MSATLVSLRRPARARRQRIYRHRVNGFRIVHFYPYRTRNSDELRGKHLSRRVGHLQLGVSEHCHAAVVVEVYTLAVIGEPGMEASRQLHVYVELRVLVELLFYGEALF